MKMGEWGSLCLPCTALPFMGLVGVCGTQLKFYSRKWQDIGVLSEERNGYLLLQKVVDLPFVIHSKNWLTECYRNPSKD